MCYSDTEIGNNEGKCSSWEGGVSPPPHPTAHISIRGAAAGHMFTCSESWPTLNPFKAAASARVLPLIVQLSTTGCS